MRRPLPSAIAATAMLLCVASGCAKARNYTDPAGPILVGGATGGVIAGPGAPDTSPVEPGPETRSEPGPGETIRVVTFNVKYARHVDRAIALLRRPGPLRDADVLVLQEMDGAGTEEVGRALGMGYVYVPSAVHPANKKDFGVAVLSPWPLEHPRKIPLPHEHRFRKTRRAAVGVTLRLPSGLVRVFGLHLESPVGLGGSDCRDQARAVIAAAESWGGPSIVAGDFNGRGGADETAKAGFLWITRAVKNTAALLDVDHVLARGLCPAGRDAAAAADDETDASDHDPVWAVLRPCPGPS